MKRSIALAFCMILMATLFCGSAKAATYSSDYLESYYASLSTGNSAGKLSLDFSARARGSVKTIGISSIAVYTADGSYVKTISGSTSNGLLASQTISHEGTYTINVTPGQAYYLRLTFAARTANSGDSKPYTTNTATAAS